MSTRDNQTTRPESMRGRAMNAEQRKKTVGYGRSQQPRSLSQFERVEYWHMHMVENIERIL